MKFFPLKIASIAAVFAFASVYGQSGDFTVSGKAVNASGTGIPMATVTYTSIAQRLSWDFSRADGTFGNPTAVFPFHRSNDNQISLSSSGPVSIDIFDMTGKKIRTVSSKHIDKGIYVIDQNRVHLSDAMYFLKITSGNSVRYQKLFNTGKGLRTSAAEAAVSTNDDISLMKKFAAVDTIRVGKTGYSPVKIPITTYTDNVGNVTLTQVNVDSLVNALFGKMSQLQKYGQLCMPPFTGTTINPTVIASNNCGSIFGGGDCFNTSNTATSCANLFDSYQTATMTNTTLKIPLLCSYDAVHGASAVPGAVIFPHNMGLGAIQDTLLVQKAFRVEGIEIRGSGANWGFGPTIAVIRNDLWGRAYEGFAETPERTSLMARHAVLGVQTTDLSLGSASLATCKHFAGDGNTVDGVNAQGGQTEGPDSTARAINLPGYTSAVAAGVGCIMPSFSKWCDGITMHQNKTLITNWLKSTAAGNPGFKGFIVGDYEAGWPLPNCVDAGLDVPMAPGCNVGIISTNDSLNNNNFAKVNAMGGTYPARIDDAVKRVLRVKYWMNLFSNYMTDRNLTGVVGSAPHRAVARKCVQASLVLLKNANTALPIPKTANVALWGQGASDVGIQCGGWTVAWQGGAGTPTPGGTTITQGVSALCTGTITSSANGSNTGNATYIIAVLSEQPYAEVSFTDNNLTNDVSNVGPGPGGNHATTTNAAVMTAIQTAHAAGKKVIVVLMAGRPMDVSSFINNCDALVWASLPGTEGNGIADVLFNDQGIHFTGKLPVSWPNSGNYTPVKGGALYAAGTGISPY
jgi:beta-glucosidase